MAIRHPGVIRGDVLRLFEGGSVAGMDDGELLARFAERRDEAAFEALVDRLGPMVLGVCRRMLADPRDVEDAFQATFLVLVRRAGSIRDRELVGPWLHGVAVRVARRARVLAVRRAIRERREDADVMVPERPPVAEWSEVRAAIDEEIGRLPEHHRRPVVLCDVEGLSREEAAARLGWTLNMVRGRLDRARGRLRDRLTRRGMAPSGAFLALAAPPMAPRAVLISMTTKAGMAVAVGRSVGVGMVSASAVSLSEGVVRMMVFSKAKLAASAMISTVVMVAGTGMLAAQGPGDDPKAPAPKPASTTPDPAATPGTKEFAKLHHDDLARQCSSLFNFNMLHFPEEIGLKTIVEVSEMWLKVDLDAAESEKARLDALREHVFRLRRVAKTAEAANKAEVAAKARVQLAEVEARLEGEKNPPRPGIDFPAAVPDAPPPALKDAATRLGMRVPDPVTPRSTAELNKARVEVARKRLDQQINFYEAGRITVDRLVDASKVMTTAEFDAAGSKAERVIALRSHYGRLSETLRREKAELAVGRATEADVAEIETSLLDAELLLAKELEVPEPTAPTELLPIPTPGPIIGAGPSAKREAPRPAPSPLALAIEAFNKKTKSPNINWTEPPLTEDEVIAAIRIWQPNREVTAIKDGLLTNLTPEGAPVEAFKRVAETRELPEGASFEFQGTLDLGGANGTLDRWGDYIYHGAWVELKVAHPATKVIWAFPIRGRLDRSITLEEAIKREQDSYGYRGNEAPQARAVIDDRIQNLRKRIKWRDREKAQTKD